MRAFTFVGTVLFAVLSVWIVTAVIHDARAPRILDVGAGFTATGVLPQEQITKAFEEARSCLDQKVRDEKRWHQGAEVSGWLSFGLTAIITVIAGLFGKPPQNAQLTAEERDALLDALKKGTAVPPGGRGRRLVTIVGALAATASILTAAAGKCQEYANDRQKPIDDLRSAIKIARTAVTSATKQQDAQNALDDLHYACIHGD